MLSNVFTSRVVFKTWLTLKYTLRGPRQFLTFFSSHAKRSSGVKKVVRDQRWSKFDKTEGGHNCSRH